MSLLVDPILSLVDTAYVGRGLGAISLAALGASLVIFLLFSELDGVPACLIACRPYFACCASRLWLFYERLPAQSFMHVTQLGDIFELFLNRGGDPPVTASLFFLLLCSCSDSNDDVGQSVVLALPGSCVRGSAFSSFPQCLPRVEYLLLLLSSLSVLRCCCWGSSGVVGVYSWVCCCHCRRFLFVSLSLWLLVCLLAVGRSVFVLRISASRSPCTTPPRPPP